MDYLLCRKLWSECCVHLVGVNRLSACKEFLVCIVGKMTQDVGMV